MTEQKEIALATDAAEPGGEDAPNFTAAMEELESILRRIEADEVDLDTLAGELGRATELVEICRAKIQRAEVEVDQLVERLEE